MWRFLVGHENVCLFSYSSNLSDRRSCESVASAVWARLTGGATGLSASPCHNYPTMPCAFHHVHPCRTQLLCLAERAIQSMTAACDPKLCKSLVPIFNTIPKERPYRARASYILPYRICASGHRNLGLDHYQHFQHFSARVRGEEQRFGLS